MTITINLKKVKKFASKHKEAIAVGVVAIVATHTMRKNSTQMKDFIANKGLMNEFCYLTGK